MMNTTVILTICTMASLLLCGLAFGNDGLADKTETQTKAPATLAPETKALEMSANEAKTAITQIVTGLQTAYIDPTRAQGAIAQLQSMSKTGRFAGGIDFNDFKVLVEGTLFKYTRDSGFELTEVAFGSALDEQSLQSMGIRAQILDNNIGYIEIDGNFDFAEAISLVTEYFKTLAQVDALIIDLSRADESNISLITHLLGYFLDSKTNPNINIGQIKFNHGTQVMHPVSHEGVKPYSADFPLYIINSAFVAGAWEWFGYTLQQHRRAIIVGELSMGVGFIQTRVKVSDKMFLSMAGALYIPPHGFDDWNEHGIVPDHQVKQPAALEKAFHLATRQLQR